MFSLPVVRTVAGIVEELSKYLLNKNRLIVLYARRVSETKCLCRIVFNEWVHL